MANKRKINILDLRDSPWVDGPGRTILDCASSLEGVQYHFVIGTFSGEHRQNNAYADEAGRRGLSVVTIEERGAFDWRIIGSILTLIEKYNIDVIHTHDFRTDIFGFICAKIKRVRIVSTVHGWIANDLKGKIYTRIDKFILRFFDKIVSVSSRTRSLLKAAGISGECSVVINNALIVDNYTVDRSNASFRKKLGLDEADIIIANIGRLSPEKGQKEFLQAARKLRALHDNVKFVLIGIGPDDKTLQDYVKKNGIADIVVFAGYCSDMVSAYNSVDLVVQSSFTEGMPNVVLESLLMTVPVIATDVGGTGEIILDQKNGVLVNPGSVNELVESINNYLVEPKGFVEMAKNGRDTIINNFNHNRRIMQLASVYDDVVNL